MKMQLSKRILFAMLVAVAIILLGFTSNSYADLTDELETGEDNDGDGDGEDEANDDEEDDDLSRQFEIPDDGRNLRGKPGNHPYCKYDLKKLANRVLKASLTYDAYRDPSNPSDNFQDKSLPKFIKPRNFSFDASCVFADSGRALAFFTTLPGGVTRHAAGCTASPAGDVYSANLGAYNCNGTQLTCGNYDIKIQNGNKAQDVLIIMSPGTTKVPKAYKVYFSSHQVSDVWCDSYPFDQ